MPNSITFFGGGNMASAIMGGLASASAPGSIQVQVVDPLATVGARWIRDFQAQWHAGVSLPACTSACWVLAVKPQDMAELCAQLHDAAPDRSALVLSVAAGVRLATLARWLGPRHRIVRGMPNTPALIGLGISALYAGPQPGAQHSRPDPEDPQAEANRARLATEDRQHAQALLQGVGETLWVNREAQLDAITAVSGSGPAYVFRFIEALQDAATALGLDPDQARQLVLATLHGATALVRTSALHPRVLREQVTSKGGTTAAALAVMDQGDFQGLIRRALEAAALRSIELSQLADTGSGPGRA
jgi:pyrroline-5-carboxylate reductase